MDDIKQLIPKSTGWAVQTKGRFVFWSKGADMVRTSMDVEDGDELVHHLAIRQGSSTNKILEDFGAADAVLDPEFPEATVGVTHWFLPVAKETP